LFYVSIVVLYEKLHPADEGNYQENEDLGYIDVPEGDNNEGKS
jgi:hypothetical protein